MLTVPFPDLSVDERGGSHPHPVSMVKEVVVDEDADEEDDADESPEDVDVRHEKGRRVSGLGGRQARRLLEQAYEEAHEDCLHHSKTLLQRKGPCSVCAAGAIFNPHPVLG